MKREVLAEFYERTELIKLPDSSSHRQHKIKRLNGSTKAIRRQISSVEDLRKELRRFKGRISQIYYSVACFINPERVRGKIRDGYRSILYKADVPIDIDVEFSEEGLEEARLKALKALEIVKKLGWKVKTIRFSNNKGFHIICDDGVTLPGNPDERVEFIEKLRKEQIKHFKEVSLDKGVFLNPFSVIKMTGTASVKTGFVSTELTEKQLKQPIKKLINSVHHLCEERPLIPTREMMERVPAIPPAVNSNSESLNRRGRRFSQLYITNRTAGLQDRHVLFLRYKDLSFNSIKEDVKKLMELYKLPETHFYKDDDFHYVLCFKTMSYRRLRKIMNNSKADNIKHKKLRFPVSRKEDEFGNIIRNKPKYLEKLGNSDHQYQSRPHLKFFSLPLTANTHGAYYMEMNKTRMVI